MAKRRWILTSDDVIRELDGDDYFLELDDLKSLLSMNCAQRCR